MKLNGQRLSQEYTHIFPLPRANGSSITFRLSPLPLGFHQRLRQQGITPPTPPTRIARDSSGKPLRDHNGTAIFVAEAQHPDYLNETELYHQRVAVLSIVEALRSDPDIEFETTLPKTSNHTLYADSIFSELESSGLSAGDLILLCREICRISNLLDQHLTQTQANFSTPIHINST